MKTTTFLLLSLFLVASLPCFAALNYTITFTGSGASTTVGDVLVQNLTKGTTVTVPAGNVLNLSKPASSNPQKSKSSALGTTTMTYAKGDQLLYKGTSGNYSTVVTDVPTGSKTSNFNFTACTDADGNNYTVVTIGDQTWMAENLKTTKYNDGTAISEVTDNAVWTKSTPAYCWYGNNATYKNTYGALYNWYAVNTAKLAPTGWHVSTDAEWTTLENYVTAHLGASGSVTKALAATINWTTSTLAGTVAGAIGNDLSKNNSSGFSALPGGKRGVDGTFWLVGSTGSWWSSTEGNTGEALSRGLGANGGGVSRYGSYNPTGYSVRCVRD